MENDDYLLISGLQHFIFCRRQWALIHIEQQWKENVLTAEGKVQHSRVHDIRLSDRRDGKLTVRSLPVKNDRFGITGCCDAVEFIPAENGIVLKGHIGMWQPYPIEYKHGHKKADDCDRLQLVAQAMCLEEMLSCSISEGAVFYFETRQRERILISDELREAVEKSVSEMRKMYERAYTPVVRKHKGCKNCSIADICLPELQKERGNASVANYIEKMLKWSEINEKTPEHTVYTY